MGAPQKRKTFMISIQEIDETMLEALLAVAMSDAEPEEVMPPVEGPPGWNDMRQAAFRSFYASRRDGLRDPHAETMFAIVEEERVLGSGRLARHAPETFETGLWLARSARGRGMGSKALLALMQRAAAEGAKRLIARTTQSNIAAIGALRNCGAAIAEPDEHGQVVASFRLSD